jgi:hypothetical protein
MPTAAQARDRWRGPAEPVKFTAKDFEILDLTLCLVPDLRICALALKQARQSKLKYPVKSAEELIAHLDDGQLVAGRHVIDAGEIRTYLHEGLFPIEHEGALLSAVYAGLGRHRTEMAIATAERGKARENVIAVQSAQKEK